MINQRTDVPLSTSVDMMELIHELKIHQAELEIQNEELKRAQSELSTLHAEFVELFDFAPSTYLILNPAGVINRINLTGVSLFGREKIFLTNISIYSLLDPDSENAYYQAKNIATETGEKQTVELKLKRTDEESIWVRADIHADFNDDGAVMQWRISMVDITSQKAAESALLESESRFRVLFENAPLPYQSLDECGDFIEVNETWLSTLGYAKKEVIGKNFSEFLHPDWKDCFKEQFSLFKTVGAVHGIEFVMRKKDGTDILASFHGKIDKVHVGQCNQTHCHCVFSDITRQRLIEEENRKLENQLRHAQKMEAVGTLAGGIAHDFNNILWGMIGFTEMSLLEAPENSSLEENLKMVLSAGHRAKDLVRQILTFSHMSEREKKPLELRLLLDEALKLLRASIPTTIEIKQSISKKSTMIFGDSTQIHQVIINLFTNAAHAMEPDGGVLEVTLRPVNVDRPRVMTTGELVEGHYVKLSVQDTGAGMNPATLERIFEPYFTTKQKGAGTGLGLAVVHGIVKSHGGVIDVTSEPGKGSVFDVYFPRIDKVILEPKKESLPLSKGSERILFVDDEVVLGKLVTRMLEPLGYTLVTKTNGMEALDLFRNDPDRFDLVITDLTMPFITGDKLAREMIKIRPDIPVILCSGYSEKISDEKIKEIGIRTVLLKPIVSKDMSRIVRQVLDEAKS